MKDGEAVLLAASGSETTLYRGDSRVAKAPELHMTGELA
ncbi:hypothetical protein FHS20_001431 [Phyllobacterium endophyticum]|nr:hypothetical protein [Phyllobacterium endophyticum]